MSENHNLTFLNIQEQDRQRIARDLHDTSLQNLAHLIHKIELSSMYIDVDPNQAKLELAVVSKRLRETIDEIRSIIFDLRPMTFDDLGLKTALETLLLNIKNDCLCEIESDIDDVSCENNLVLVSIFRLCQESLTNFCKYAEAEKLVFSCKNHGKFCVVNIVDNGKGFSSEIPDDGKKHFGFSLMRERVALLNGKINISSELGKGTKIYIEIPLENNE